MFLIPENEQGTIVTFVQMEKLHGFKIVSVSTKYPDAIVERNGVEYRAEFEFMASNFILHQHDIRKCDIVICWKSDINKAEFPIPIIELSDNESILTPLFVPDENKVELFYWKGKAKSSDNAVKSIIKEFQLYKLQNEKKDKNVDPDERMEARRKHLLSEYRNRPNISMSEAATLLNVSKGTVAGDLKWLVDSGIVKVFRNGKFQTVVLNDGSEEFTKGL